MYKAINKMVLSISEILIDCLPTIYLYGSVPLNDFKLGWSDIDILCLTKKEMSQAQANELVNLRQKMSEGDEKTYYRSFEGGMLSVNVFLHNATETVVYWGTSGQRITDSYRFDSFSKYVLLDSGVLLCGEDVRKQITPPTYKDMVMDVKTHYESIRKYAHLSGRSIYSFGWLLDISRCIYTLKTGRIIAKTAAGEWALQNKVCPVENDLEYAIQVRNNPLMLNETILSYAATLNPKIQLYADVLESEIERAFL